jgi:hypothetical protein
LAPRRAEKPCLHPRATQRDLNADALRRGAVNGTGLAAAIRRTTLRILAVAALALAGLLVFGLLPGGRDVDTVAPSPHLLPAAPTIHSLHPYGPNRPVRQR